MWKRLRFDGVRPGITSFDKTGIIRDLMTYWVMSFSGVTQLLEAQDFRILLADWIESPSAIDRVFGRDHGIPSILHRRYNQIRALQFYQSYPNKIIELAKSDLTEDYWKRLNSLPMVEGKLAVLGGIGTGAIVLDRLGNEVYYIEVPGKHREFTEWRFCLHGYKHGADIGVRNTFASLSELDGILIEIIHPKTLISVVVNAMAAVLKPDGTIIVAHMFDDEMGEEFQESMVKAGFAFDSNCWRRR